MATSQPHYTFTVVSGTESCESTITEISSSSDSETFRSLASIGSPEHTKPNLIEDCKEHQDRNNINYLQLGELMSENSAMFDDRGLYLRVCAKKEIHPNPELNEELVKKLEYCTEFFTQNVHKIILESTEARVRFKPDLDTTAIRHRCEDINLSDDLKSLLTEYSHAAYDTMEENGVLGNLIQLDINQDVIVKKDGENRCIKVHTDLITCHVNQKMAETEQNKDEISATREFPDITSNNSDTSEDYSSDFHDDKTENSQSTDATVSSCDTLDKTYDDNSSQKSSKSNTDTADCQDSQSTQQTTQRKVRAGIVVKQNSVGVSFVLSLRQSVPAETILSLYLAAMLHEKLSTYILVCHIGPLVDNEIVLYEYRSRTFGVGLEGTNVDQVMKTWARQEGRLIFPITPMKDFVKHTIYEYQGLQKKTKPKKDNHVIKIYLE